MSAFDIEQFKGLVTAGARPNLFQVEIGKGAESLSPFLVTAASLPGRTIGTASVFYRGRELKLAGDMTFAPWTTTILNDSGMVLRAFIEDWMNRFIEDAAEKTPSDNPTGSPTEYFAPIVVTQLDKGGEPIRTYTLVDAWPTDISDVPLSFDSNDQISSFSCTWQYQYIEVESFGGGAEAEG